MRSYIDSFVAQINPTLTLQEIPTGEERVEPNYTFDLSWLPSLLSAIYVPTIVWLFRKHSMTYDIFSNRVSGQQENAGYKFDLKYNG